MRLLEPRMAWLFFVIGKISNAHLRIAGNAALCGTRKLLNTPAVGTTVKCAKTKFCFGIKRFYLFVSQLLLFCG